MKSSIKKEKKNLKKSFADRKKSRAFQGFYCQHHGNMATISILKIQKSSLMVITILSYKLLKIWLSVLIVILLFIKNWILENILKKTYLTEFNNFLSSSSTFFLSVWKIKLCKLLLRRFKNLKWKKTIIPIDWYKFHFSTIIHSKLKGIFFFFFFLDRLYIILFIIYFKQHFFLSFTVHLYAS